MNFILKLNDYGVYLIDFSEEELLSDIENHQESVISYYLERD